MSAVDDAGDAFAFDLGDFGRHEIHVMHDVRRWWSATGATTGAAATRRSRRQTIRRSSGGCSRSKFRVEVRRQLHVLMEQRGAACQLLRRVILEERSDDRASRKCRRLSERRRWERRRHGGHSQ